MITVAEKVPNAVFGGEPSLSIQKDACIRLASDGCTEAQGYLLQCSQRYLLHVADRLLPERFRAKLDPEDVVQDTLLAAQAEFSCFQGSTEKELLGWLRAILLNRVRDTRRRYLTPKRAICRELSLNALVGKDLEPTSAAACKSPCQWCVDAEDSALLQWALRRLPESYRQAVVLRNLEGLSFAEVGAAMDRSGDAARKLWTRAMQRLRANLK